LCSCSGLAPEWQNFHSEWSDELREVGGYPVPDQLVDPESLSPHAYQMRLLTYNDIFPQMISKRLLWSYTEQRRRALAFVD